MFHVLMFKLPRVTFDLQMSPTFLCQLSHSVLMRQIVTVRIQYQAHLPFKSGTEPSTVVIRYQRPQTILVQYQPLSYCSDLVPFTESHLSRFGTNTGSRIYQVQLQIVPKIIVGCLLNHQRSRKVMLSYFVYYFILIHFVS